MNAKIEKFTISTKGFDDLIDITSKVQDIVSSFGMKAGIVNITVTSSCASILTLECEAGLALDLPKFLDELVPLNKIYQHDNVWHDGNAHAHLKSCLFSNNITLPIEDNKIVLDTWQKIVLIDFDNKPRIRQVVVSAVS